jgi:hypothetical protein
MTKPAPQNVWLLDELRQTKSVKAHQRGYLAQVFRWHGNGNSSN